MKAADRRTSPPPSGWGVVWHQIRWDLQRMRGWIVAITGLMITQLALTYRDDVNVLAASLGAVSMLLILLFAIIAVQGDSPLHPAAFYRGRPMSWWVMPSAKILFLLTALAGPALVVGAIVIAQYDDEWRHRATLVFEIISGAGIFAVVGFSFGAVTLNVAEMGVFLVAAYLVNLTASALLRYIEWPGAPWLGWLAIAAGFALALDVYRRMWKPRSAFFAMVLISLIGPLTSNTVKPRTVRAAQRPITDSVHIVIDSVTNERPHIVRVAFTVETTAQIDGIRFPYSAGNVGRHSTWFSLGRLNRPSALRVEGSMAKGGVITISDSLRSHNTTVSEQNSGGGEGFGVSDLHFETADPRGVRRARAVGLVATWDTLIADSTIATVSGFATGFQSSPEGTLPVTPSAQSRTGGVHWLVRTTLDDGKQSWILERSSLGAVSEDSAQSRMLSSLGRYSTRFIEQGRLLSTGLDISGASTSYGVLVVPGLIRRVETFGTSVETLGPPSRDTVALQRIHAVGPFRYHAQRSVGAAEVRP